MELKSIEPGENGFSLLEAIIGLAIVALTLSAFYSAVNICIEAIVRARDEQVAAGEANRILAFLGIEYPLTEGMQTIPLPEGRTATLTIRPRSVSAQAGMSSRLLLFDVDLTFRNKQNATPPIRIHTLRIKQNTSP